MDPYFWLVSILSVNAERLTISRQRPLYVDRPIHVRQKFIVSLNESATKCSAALCVSSRPRTSSKMNAAVFSAPRVNSATASPFSTRIGTSSDRRRITIPPSPSAMKMISFGDRCSTLCDTRA